MPPQWSSAYCEFGRADLGRRCAGNVGVDPRRGGDEGRRGREASTRGGEETRAGGVWAGQVD
jgi:hypothetical protein